MERTTRKQLDHAFRAYARAYSAAGLGDADPMRGEGTTEYRPTGLDLVLERPSAYATGGVWISPWHNPIRPQHFEGASAHYTSTALSRFDPHGGIREAVAMLRTATRTLEAVIRVHGTSTRAADIEAVAHLDAIRNTETERELEKLRKAGVIA